MIITKVAIGVIVDKKQNCIYVSKRPSYKDLGDLWEFPGGKVETGESIEQALKRELYEELGIHVLRYKFLMQQDFCYPSCFVSLYFYLVSAYQGLPFAKENQEILKIKIDKLQDVAMPEANKTIIDFLVAEFSVKNQ